LGQILGKHPLIAEWYEPYFVWDYYFGKKTDDIRVQSDATPKVREFITKEFQYFTKKAQKDIVIDKSPTHVFHIPFIHAIYPNAKWIHILRDGRDVTLSIHKEWRKRALITENSDYLGFFKLTKEFLKRQPYLRNKLQALFFELKTRHTLIPSKLLNKSKWQGYAGWGPRFGGWQELIKKMSTLEFNSYQWLYCINQIYEDKGFLSEDNLIEIRYEQLISNPEDVLEKVLYFLNLAFPKSFMRKIPKLKSDNFNKWEKEFSLSQKMEISSVLTEKLIELNYETNPNWAALG
jgi:hypothetical protein